MSASDAASFGLPTYPTQSFRVNAHTLSAYYSYDCSSASSSGFVADMVSVSDHPNDDQKIANTSDSRGSATVTLHPKHVPGDYVISVTSQCTWTIDVNNG